MFLKKVVNFSQFYLKIMTKLMINQLIFSALIQIMHSVEEKFTDNTCSSDFDANYFLYSFNTGILINYSCILLWIHEESIF